MPLDQSTAVNTGAAAPMAADPARSADAQIGAVSSLLGSIDTAAPLEPALLDSAELALENRLIQVRLGVASSLFSALRAKHAPTAHHSLRVALNCSAWGAMLGLGDAERD